MSVPDSKPKKKEVLNRRDFLRLLEVSSFGLLLNQCIPPHRPPTDLGPTLSPNPTKPSTPTVTPHPKSSDPQILGIKSQIIDYASAVGCTILDTQLGAKTDGQAKVLADFSKALLSLVEPEQIRRIEIIQAQGIASNQFGLATADFAFATILNTAKDFAIIYQYRMGDSGICNAELKPAKEQTLGDKIIKTFYADPDADDQSGFPAVTAVHDTRYPNIPFVELYLFQNSGTNKAVQVLVGDHLNFSRYHDIDLGQIFTPYLRSNDFTSNPETLVEISKKLNLDEEFTQKLISTFKNIQTLFPDSSMSVSPYGDIILNIPARYSDPEQLFKTDNPVTLSGRVRYTEYGSTVYFVTQEFYSKFITGIISLETINERFSANYNNEDAKQTITSFLRFQGFQENQERFIGHPDLWNAPTAKQDTRLLAQLLYYGRTKTPKVFKTEPPPRDLVTVTCRFGEYRALVIATNKNPGEPVITHYMNGSRKSVIIYNSIGPDILIVGDDNLINLVDPYNPNYYPELWFYMNLDNTFKFQFLEEMMRCLDIFGVSGEKNPPALKSSFEELQKNSVEVLKTTKGILQEVDISRFNENILANFVLDLEPPQIFATVSTLA